jgi:hypothetical protein
MKRLVRDLNKTNCFICSTLYTWKILKDCAVMDVLVAKGVFLLVTIGAFVVTGRILKDLVKKRFEIEKSKLGKFG